MDRNAKWVSTYGEILGRCEIYPVVADCTAVLYFSAKISRIIQSVIVKGAFLISLRSL